MRLVTAVIENDIERPEFTGHFGRKLGSAWLPILTKTFRSAISCAAQDLSISMPTMVESG